MSKKAKVYVNEFGWMSVAVECYEWDSIKSVLDRAWNYLQEDRWNYPRKQKIVYRMRAIEPYDIVYDWVSQYWKVKNGDRIMVPGIKIRKW